MEAAVIELKHNGASITAGLPPYADRRKALQFMSQLLENKGTQIFERRWTQALNFVEELVVKQMAYSLNMFTQYREVNHHSGFRIRLAPHSHFGLVGVAVYPATALSFDLAKQCVSRLEIKPLRQFVRFWRTYNLRYH
jgi:hypothetical protein